MDQEKKLQTLKETLVKLKKVAIGFSGGVDSTFLLKVARDTLGDNVLAITVKSSIHPDWEFKEACELVKKIGAPHLIIDYDILHVDTFYRNPKDRCYHCKKRIFSTIRNAAQEKGISYILDGTNYDDLGDYRPGMLAAEELMVVSPLKDCKMTKDDIRYFSKSLGLQTWDKPSFACLASRIPYGQTITLEKLEMVEKAEAFLRNLGFRQIRVRHHGDIARIEIDKKELPVFVTDDIMNEVSSALKELGFAYVTLDLKGYRTGSLNEVLGKKGES